MGNNQRLLQQLVDGDYHTGEALGALLGVSRAAIWKQLKKLEESGLAIESCKRRGYRIPGGLSLLDPAQIKAGLTSDAAEELRILEIHQQIASTNDLAMERCQEGAASGSVLLAESQTAGKGRRGRQWISPYGRNIYLSAVHGFSGGVAAVEGLSLAVGVAVVEALELLGAEGVSLKWPNDILWDGRKLGGILLEITGDPAGNCEVIVGIGINVQMLVSDGDQVTTAWANLADAIAEPAPDRNLVVARLLNSLLPMIAGFEERGFAAYQQAWQRLDAFRDQAVELIAGEQRIPGIARGVDHAGSILLETDNGLGAYSGGEISLRLQK